MVNVLHLNILEILISYRMIDIVFAILDTDNNTRMECPATFCLMLDDNVSHLRMPGLSESPFLRFLLKILAI